MKSRREIMDLLNKQVGELDHDFSDDPHVQTAINTMTLRACLSVLLDLRDLKIEAKEGQKKKWVAMIDYMQKIGGTLPSGSQMRFVMEEMSESLKKMVEAE